MAPLLILAAVVTVSAGCDDGGEVRTYSAPKDAPAAKPVEWAVPAGWQPTPAREMRFASFAVNADHPEVELTVVPLPREANDLLPNVNRWERQLSLPPTPAAGLEKVVQKRDVAGKEVHSADLTGTDPATGQPRRMLAALASHGHFTWFFKLTGPVEVVEAQKPKFEEFIASLKFNGPDTAPENLPPARMAAGPPPGQDMSGGAAPPPAAGASPPAQQAAQKLAWTSLPGGWREDPNPRPMRVHTFVVEANGKQADIAVTRLSHNGVGSLLDNVNRWRGQVGLGPVEDPKASAPTEIQVAGQPGMMFNFEGPAQGDQPAKRLIVAMGSEGSMYWFFRFLGPADVVGAHQEQFTSFLRSVRFAGAAESQPQQPPHPQTTQPAPPAGGASGAGGPR